MLIAPILHRVRPPRQVSVAIFLFSQGGKVKLLAISSALEGSVHVCLGVLTRSPS